MENLKRRNGSMISYRGYPVMVGIRRRIRKPNKKISVIINADHVQASRWTRMAVNNYWC